MVWPWNGILPYLFERGSINAIPVQTLSQAEHLSCKLYETKLFVHCMDFFIIIIIFKFGRFNF